MARLNRKITRKIETHLWKAECTNGVDPRVFIWLSCVSSSWPGSLLCACKHSLSRSQKCNCNSRHHQDKNSEVNCVVSILSHGCESGLWRPDRVAVSRPQRLEFHAAVHKSHGPLWPNAFLTNEFM